MGSSLLNQSNVMLRCEMLFSCVDTGGSSLVVIIAVVAVVVIVVIAGVGGGVGLMLKKRSKPGKIP